MRAFVLKKLMVRSLAAMILAPSLSFADASLTHLPHCSQSSIDSLTARDVFTQIRYSAGEVSRKQAGISQLKLFQIKRFCGVISVREFCERAPALADVVAATEFDELVFNRSSAEKVNRAQARAKKILNLCTMAALYDY